MYDSAITATAELLVGCWILHLLVNTLARNRAAF